MYVVHDKPKIQQEDKNELLPFLQNQNKTILINIISNYSKELIKLSKSMFSTDRDEDELQDLIQLLKSDITIEQLVEKHADLVIFIFNILNIFALTNLLLAQYNSEQLYNDYTKHSKEQQIVIPVADYKADFFRAGSFYHAGFVSTEPRQIIKLLPAMLLHHAEKSLRFYQQLSLYNRYLAAMPQEDLVRYIAKINNISDADTETIAIKTGVFFLYAFNDQNGTLACKLFMASEKISDSLVIIEGINKLPERDFNWYVLPENKYTINLPRCIFDWADYYERYCQNAKSVINDPEHQQAALKVIQRKYTLTLGVGDTIHWVDAANSSAENCLELTTNNGSTQRIMLDPYLIYELAQLKPRAYLAPPSNSTQLHLIDLLEDIFFTNLAEMVGLREFFYKFSLLNKRFHQIGSGAVFSKFNHGINLVKLAGFAPQAARGTGHCLYQAVARCLGYSAEDLHNKVLESKKITNGLPNIIRTLEKIDDKTAIDANIIADFDKKIKDRQTDAEIHLALLRIVLGRPIVIINAAGIIVNDRASLKTEYQGKFSRSLNKEAIFICLNGDNQYEALIYQGEELRLTQEQLKLNAKAQQKLKDEKLETRLKKLYDRRETVILLQKGRFFDNSSEVKFNLFCQHIQGKSYDKALELLKSSVISAGDLATIKNTKNFVQEHSDFFQDLLSAKVTLNSAKVKIFKHLLQCNAFTSDQVMRFCNTKQFGKQDKFNVVARLSDFHLFFYSKTTQQKQTTDLENFTKVKAFYTQLLNLDQVGPIKIDQATEAALKSCPGGEKALAVLVGGNLVAPRGAFEHMLTLTKSFLG